MLRICHDEKRSRSNLLFVLGSVLLFLRLISYMNYSNDYTFTPDSSHVSFPFSIMSSLAMIASFRQPVLNAVSFLVFPSFFFSITLNDVVVLREYYKYTFLDMINAVTIHIPIALISIWIVLNRSELVSWNSIADASIWATLYFFIVDNKKNGTPIEGWKYTAIVFTIIPGWLLLCNKYLDVGKNMDDPYTTKFMVLKWK